MSGKEEILKDLERYGIEPKDVEKYIGEKAFRLALQAIAAEINKKAEKVHKHAAATDITEDATHKFVTEAQITEWSKKVNVFEADKTTLETSDSDIISQYFRDHSSPAARQGDVFIITTKITAEGEEEEDPQVTEYEKSAYIYNGSKWVAASGCVDADKVILRNDFTGAGDWDKIGNYVKGKIPAKGLSVEDFIRNMVTKKLQPTITAQPAVQGFKLTGAGAVEAGTKVDNAQFGTATLSAGSYTYGPATGITAQSFKVDRVAEPAGLNKTGVVSAASGTDNNGGQGFIIGDDTSVGENVCTSLKYRVTVTHNEGAVAHDNLGGQSNPQIKITAGTKTMDTVAYTPFRKFFYGSSNSKPTVNSAEIRKLTNSNAAYKAQKLTINVKPGDARVLIACVSSVKGVTQVINKSALNANITDAFKKSTVKVEGANGYKAIDYNVWVFEPAAPFEQKAELEVTLG